MSISANKSSDGDALVIHIRGRFDFGLQKEFRETYEDQSMSKYVVDMNDTEYMDSSALGMLLMMREHVGGAKANIALKNCSKDIKTILSVANFQSLFNID